MFCNNCGAQINNGQTFCPNCGAAQAPAANNTYNTYNAAPTNTSGAKQFGLYDILMVVACLVMIIGTLMPLISFGGNSINYIGSDTGKMGDGIFVIIAAILAAVLYLFNKDKAIIIPAIIAAIVLLIFTFQDETSLLLDFGADLGIGYFVMWIGIAAAAILPFTPIANERKFYIKK